MSAVRAGGAGIDGTRHGWAKLITGHVDSRQRVHAVVTVLYHKIKIVYHKNVKMNDATVL
jgi:hypothetical protein